ncbi:MAG: hypothetical protein ABI813_04540 [Bacteroidota bacterium]
MKKDFVFQHLFIDYYSASPKYLQLANSIVNAIAFKGIRLQLPVFTLQF